jgi:Secretory pathway protein Sec39
MRFSECDDGSTLTHSGLFLSILDSNGGVQILDCCIMGRVAAQNMPLHEYEQYQHHGFIRPQGQYIIRQALQYQQHGFIRPQGHQQQHHQQQQQESVSFPLATIIVSRSHFVNALHTLSSRSVGNLQWCGSSGFGTEGSMPPLALLMDKLPKLVVLTFQLPPEDVVQESGPLLQSSLLSLSFPSHKAAMKSLDGSNLAFVTMQRGRSKFSQRYTNLLTYFVMEQLQPVSIVETLASESKYEEAIASASKLSAQEQTTLAAVVADCRRKLWETKHDVPSLEATGTSSYIIRQALSIVEYNDDDVGTDDVLTVEVLHSLLKLALSCSERSKDNNDKVVKIRDVMVKLGSYELLCRHFGSSISIRQFRHDFLRVETHQLLEHLARRAHTKALTTLVFRHKKEIGPRRLLDVLSLLPASLDPTFYSHLVPVFRDGSFSDYFFSLKDEGSDAIPWSHMRQYLSEAGGFPVVLDLLDEKAVLDYNRGGFCHDPVTLEDSVSMLADWFNSRANLIQSYVGDIDCVIRLCELGLKCLTSKGTLDNAALPIGQVHKVWQIAVSLQRMKIDDVVSMDDDGIDIRKLMEMDLASLFELVF